MIKYCPYCTRPLGFIALVRQRLSASRNSGLRCDKCGSRISVSGSAMLGVLTGAGFACGYFWGRFAGHWLTADWLVLLSSAIVAAAVIAIGAYVTAPIKRA